MDRKYLVAALAIVATFAVFSHGLRNGRLVQLACREYGAIAGHCTGSSLTSRVIGQMRSRLRPGHPEEAQMLAELNLPMVTAQAKAVVDVAKQEVQAAKLEIEAAKCARETAVREAERARREARMATREEIKARKSAAMAVAYSSQPIALRIERLGGIEASRQVNPAVIDGQLIASNVSLRLSGDQLARISIVASKQAQKQMETAKFAVLSNTGLASASSHRGCKGSLTSSQIQAQYRSAIRNAMHSLQNSANTKNAVHALQNNGGYL